MKHDYFFSIARAVSTGSKDPSTKVGCVISRPDGSVASVGYNGFIKKADERYMSFDRPMKYLLTIHAEINSLNFCKDPDLDGYAMHVTHAPCYNCLKMAVHEGIREIYYENNELTKKASQTENEAVVRIIKATDAVVQNRVTGDSYIKELADMYGWEWVNALISE